MKEFQELFQAHHIKQMDVTFYRGLAISVISFLVVYIYEPPVLLSVIPKENF